MRLVATKPHDGMTLPLRGRFEARSTAVAETGIIWEKSNLQAWPSNDLRSASAGHLGSRFGSDQQTADVALRCFAMCLLRCCRRCCRCCAGRQTGGPDSTTLPFPSLPNTSLSHPILPLNHQTKDQTLRQLTHRTSQIPRPHLPHGRRQPHGKEGADRLQRRRLPGGACPGLPAVTRNTRCCSRLPARTFE